MKEMKEERKREKRGLDILDKSEIESLQKIIDKNFKSAFDLNDFGVMLGSEEKIWLAARDVFTFDFSKLPVNSLGMNFGKIKKNDKMRLTIEGSQLVGSTAERNVAIISDVDAKKFLRGEDIDPMQKENCDEHNFVIVKTEGGTVLGSALLAEGRLKNFLPKSRRLAFEAFK